MVAYMLQERASMWRDVIGGAKIEWRGLNLL